MSDKTGKIMARAIYAEFENRPCYAQVQMNGVIADECATAALAALEQAGYVVLPKEPTDEMCLAGYNAGTGDWGEHYDNDRELSRGRCAPAYRAMISASKTAKEG